MKFCHMMMMMMMMMYCLSQGPIESVSLGEIRVSLRQSLVKLGVGFLSRDPKLQVLICDLEVVTRTTKSNKGPTKGTQKSKTRKTRSAGRGKWMVIANVARFLSVSVTDLALKVANSYYRPPKLYIQARQDLMLTALCWHFQFGMID